MRAEKAAQFLLDFGSKSLHTGPDETAGPFWAPAAGTGASGGFGFRAGLGPAVGTPGKEVVQTMSSHKPGSAEVTSS